MRPAWRRRLAAIGLVGLCLVEPPAEAAPPDDVLGWRAARWGMTQPELQASFGFALAALPGRWQYGGAYAERAILNLSFADQRFIAFFQMGETTGRLQQVLLERQPRQTGPSAYEAVLGALQQEYGPPYAQCPPDRPGAAVKVREARWVFPTTTVHVVFLDFLNRDLLFEDPNRDRDIREPSTERQRIDPAALPRRVVIRFHPTARTDLLGDGDCMSGPSR